MESRAMSLAKARSSAVMPSSVGGGGPATVSSGLERDEAREMRLRAPFLRPSRFSALATARLHQTMDRQSTVPVTRELRERYSLQAI